jgi:hypothetical protein
MRPQKEFNLTFSIQKEGADLRKIGQINVNSYLTPKAAELAPALNDLIKASIVIKSKKDFSSSALEAVMQSSPDLSLTDEAWLTVAEAGARPGIKDIGVELTPSKGLELVEAGANLISELAKEWQPVMFQIIKKTSGTEQRKVVEHKEVLQKFILRLTFERKEQKNGRPIQIPEAMLTLANSTFRFCHIWYNPVALRTINVNFTCAMFRNAWQPFEWVITL